MQDRVGSHVPAEKEIEQAIHDIDKAVAKLRPLLISLTPAERQAIPKFRPGGEEVVGAVGRLATKYGVALPNISVESMNADLAGSRLTRTMTPQRTVHCADARDWLSAQETLAGCQNRG